MSDRAPQDAGQALTIHGVSADPSITFSPGGKTVLTITPDGRFVLGEGATVDDAAKAICEIATRIMRPPFTQEDVDALDAIPCIAEPDADRSCAIVDGTMDADDWQRILSLTTRIKALLPPSPETP